MFDLIDGWLIKWLSRPGKPHRS